MAGAYTLDQTNDPVLKRCYPPGVPRVYFHTRSNLCKLPNTC